MKYTLTLALLFSALSASAQVVFVNPQLINFGHSVQVQIQNTTDGNLNCNGMVYMHTDKQRMETGYYFDYIMKNGFSLRMFNLMNFQERIIFATHSISCMKSN